MKKTLLLLAMTAFLFSGAIAQNSFGKITGKKHVYGQESKIKTPHSQAKAEIFGETFEGAALPTDWTTVDGACTWGFSLDGSSQYFEIPAHTTYAFVNDDACNGDMSNVMLVTPSIDLSAVTGAILEFASFNDTDACTIKVSTDGGTTWTDLQLITDNAAWTTIQLSLADYDGMADVKIGFHYNDLGVWGYGWALDDVRVYTIEGEDLAATAVTPVSLLAGNSTFPSVTVNNYGASTQDAFDVTVVINNGTTDVYTSTKNVTAAGLASLGNMVITMTDEWTIPAIGAYTITATVELAGDIDLTNDEISGTCNVVEGVTAYVINADAGTFASMILPIGTETQIATYDVTNFPMAMEYAIDTYYIIRNSPAQLLTIDAVTGTETLVAAITGMTGTPVGLAYDWTNDLMYIMVLATTTNLPQLGTIDLTTGVATLIGTDAPMIIAIEFDNAGVLYGPSVGDDILYSINTATGACTAIGPIGIDLNYGQDISYDKNSGIMYTISAGATVALCSIDLTTGAYTQLATVTGAQYGCIAIPWVDVANNEIEAEASVSIYPNPSTGNVNILVSEISVVTIMDVAGRVIDTYNVNANSSINVNQPAGLYFVQVSSNGKVSTHKLVIQ